jgi:UDP-N-acetylmuramate--alanine ligase
MNELKNYFVEFIEKTPSFGKSFICIDDKINNELIKKIKNKNFYTYGQQANSNFRIKNIKQNKSFSKFDIEVNLPNKKTLSIKKIKIPLLGVHNIRNSVGALCVALSVGIPIQKIKKGLTNFKGVERRFNKIFTYNNIDFYDDYAHHPTEIKVVLQGVKKVFDKYDKVCIFQPHRISRLKDLKKEFTYAFKDADTVILCPIFSAGEKMKLGFNYDSFAKEIMRNSKVKLFMVKDNIQLAKFLKQNMHGKKIVVGMGAGSISNWMKELPSLI